MNGLTIGNSAFKNYKLEGYLKKRAQKIELFQTKVFITRYFKIDFDLGQIAIQTKAEEKSPDL